MRRPSVLFMNRVYPPVSGATGRMLRDLARSFAREGWRVTVVTTGAHGGKERDGSIRVIRIKGSDRPESALAYLWVLIKMTWAALRLSPSHLIVTLSDPPLLAVVGQVVRRFKGGRHINWCHDLYPDIFPALNVRMPRFVMAGLKGLMTKALTRCDKVIVIGRCMAQSLTKNGLDPCHITVIPNWPDFELMRQMTSTANDDHHISKRMMHDVEGATPYDEQLQNGPRFRVLYAGNIGRAHPIDSVLDAAEILVEEHPEIEFVFVGDGPKFDKIAEQRSLRNLSNIRLMPYQPASTLRALMESGDVHLISVKDEAAGLLVPCKLYSALAAKRPCIFVGPEHSETAKVIHDFNAGVVVAQGDARALADQIKRYRLDGEAWFGAQNGAANAADIFVPKDAIDAWISRAWSVVKEDVAA